jgi:hypothetical protein
VRALPSLDNDPRLAQDRSIAGEQPAGQVEVTDGSAMRGPALRCRRADILIIRLRKEVSEHGLDVDRGNHRRVSIAGFFGLGGAYGMPAELMRHCALPIAVRAAVKLAACDFPLLRRPHESALNPRAVTGTLLCPVKRLRTAPQVGETVAGRYSASGTA